MISPVFLSLVTTPVPIPKGIHIEYNHHFFIHANITIHDPTNSTRVKIAFPSQNNGLHNVQVLPKVFRK